MLTNDDAGGASLEAQGEEITAEQAAEDYAAEVARWREVRGMSKRALALAMGFDPSYVSHVESAGTSPARNSHASPTRP
ncbi:helix-turn-helix domain-containing protein [Streptomyces rimosus]|uniref:helix-turn-helix domain-containing protein n=1 Tax=Streptomyces rimosus TaxID=1927 RepID=UPI000AABE70B|nr:helix-turn-helix transcriptional regulator [Streptomyces rimosus]